MAFEIFEESCSFYERLSKWRKRFGAAQDGIQLGTLWNFTFLLKFIPSQYHYFVWNVKLWYISLYSRFYTGSRNTIEPENYKHCPFASPIYRVSVVKVRILKLFTKEIIVLKFVEFCVGYDEGMRFRLKERKNKLLQKWTVKCTGTLFILTPNKIALL